MNNSEEYKKAVDQIHAPEELKQKTFEKMKKQNTTQAGNNILFSLKLLSAVAVCLIVFTVGYKQIEQRGIDYTKKDPKEIATVQIESEELPRFKNIDELLNILKENNQQYFTNGMMAKSTGLVDTVNEAESEDLSAGSQDRALSSEVYSDDYSKTNNQVEDVDEADIVKTDGKNIYYVSNSIVNIVDGKSLELLSEIRGFINNNDGESFRPYQIFVNGKKLVVIGTYTKTEKIEENGLNEKKIAYSYFGMNMQQKTKAMLYDLEDIRNPKLVRELALDGYYKNARMIGDNVYFISVKGNIYYRNDIKDIDILPVVEDSIATTNSKTIDCTEIAYFPGSTNYVFTLIGGFNINNEEPLNVETFFGAGDIMYCSKDNLYLTQMVWEEDYTRNKVEIYKFELDSSKISIKAKGEVEGYINNQFSLDEFEGNLRIATTVIVRPSDYNEETDEFIEEETTNRVYILDENLQELSRIDNMANGEKIYAVRFMGRVGYVVTFEQIDPLFVLDLSDSRNPQIKGELKIPGYSSYLHPYDDTHVIGIGYNTKDNGYGGVRNSNMKMSMFDISDLNNPKEMFNIDIGGEYVYSEVLYDHKALFYKPSDNLIGFPYNSYSEDYDEDHYVFEIFHIDLEKGFEEFCKINQEYDYGKNISRMVYIGNIAYGLASEKIISFDLNTKELLHELDLNMIEEEYTIFNSEDVYIEEDLEDDDEDDWEEDEDFDEEDVGDAYLDWEEFESDDEEAEDIEPNLPITIFRR